MISKDLSKPTSPKELYREIENRDIKIDNLVNNAGNVIKGDFLDLDMETQRDMIQLNLVSLTELTNLFGKEMEKREGGNILNVASIASVYPIPKLAVYSATKSYVLSFSIAIQNEFPDKINVTALCPGYTDTDQIDTDRELLDPKKVAKQGFEAMKNKETIVIPGNIKHKLAFQLPRILTKNRTAILVKKYIE